MPDFTPHRGVFAPRNWVERVVMATGPGNGHAKQRLRHCVNLLMRQIGNKLTWLGAIEGLRPNGENTGGDQVLAPLSCKCGVTICKPISPGVTCLGSSTSGVLVAVKVLVVDDAVVFRKGISDALDGDPDVQVIGTAANGKLALQKMALNLPDLVVLDVEMPEMDGLAAVAEIRKLWPRLPVIMCSAHTTEGARVTLQALERGANDFVTKPVSTSMAESLAHFRNELLPRIKGNCRHLLGSDDSRIRPTIATTVRPTPAASLKTSATVTSPPPRPAGFRAGGQIDLVVIGVSTGGPNALGECIPMLPGDLPVPVLIVQHMPAMFTKLLAERLASKSALKIEEASAGIIAKAGQVWIAPGGRHLTVARINGEFRLSINDDPPENSCRPAADVLFRSAANACGGNTLAVVLTGMGEDGLIGCKLIYQAGGQIIVQNRESSVVWGMPGQVAKAGLAEKQLPLRDLAGEIITRLKAGRPNYHGMPRKA